MGAMTMEPRGHMKSQHRKRRDWKEGRSWRLGWEVCGGSVPVSNRENKMAPGLQINRPSTANTYTHTCAHKVVQPSATVLSGMRLCSTLSGSSLWPVCTSLQCSPQTPAWTSLPHSAQHRELWSGTLPPIIAWN